MVADGYKDTEIGVIPDEWEAIELGDIATFSKGKGISKKDISEDGVECIRYGELFTTYNEIITTVKSKTNSTTNMTYSKINDTLMPTSDVTPTGLATASALNKEGVILGGDILIIRSKDILNSYLSYFIRSHKKQIMKLVSGSTVYHIYANDMKKLKIPLPPLKEQEKIADILSTADDKIDAIASQIDKAETLKKGLLQKLLSEGIGHSEFKDSEIGKIPDSWEVMKLDKLIENKSIISHLDGNHGGLYPKQSEFVESGTPYLSANMIKDNDIDFSLAKFLTEERASKFRKGVAKNKDVLFAHNATVGPVTILKTDLEYVILSTTLTYYRCDLEKLDNYYLMNYMKSVYFINQYEKFMKQSTRNQIPITQQRQLFFIVPPLEEQKQIADILSTADEKLKVLRAKKEKYETLKKGLLQKLLSGEVRV